MNSHAELKRWTAQTSKGLPRELSQFVQGWQESVATLMRENWNALLGAAIDVRLLNTDAGPARKLIPQLPDPGYGGQFSMGMQGARALLACPGQVIRMLVADLLGMVTDEADPRSELTPVELSMVELLFGEVSRALAQAWPQLQTLPCHMEAVVNRPIRTRLFGPDEDLVSARFQLVAGEVRETMTWVVTLESLRQIIGETPLPDAKPAAFPSQGLEQIVEQVRLTLVVELGRALVSLGDLQQLAPGDVLILDQAAQQPLRARVGGHPKYLGHPCRIGVRQGFRVQTSIDK